MGYILKNIKKSPFKDLDYSKISSDFGYREYYNNVTHKKESGYHSGIDMTTGTIIVATSKGKVTACRKTIKGYTEEYASGNYVTLYHGKGIYTTYCHMKYGSIKVKVGDIVSAGQELGTIGSTGKSTGTHLHFGVKANGSWVDPKPYLLENTLLPEYNSPSTNILKYKVGDKVKFTGTLYRDSYGNGAGQKKTNLSSTIYLVNTKGKCPYNINNGLGWVKEEDLSPSSETQQYKYYKVVKGDTLWGIAKKMYGNGKKYPEIAKANNINNPDKISVGQTLLIP